MAGLILDNVLVFLFWIIRGWCIDFKTRNWPSSDAIIHEASANQSSYPSATVHYSYEIEECRLFGQLTAHFWFTNSAYEFAIQMKRHPRVTVRYNPDSPTESFVSGIS